MNPRTVRNTLLVSVIALIACFANAQPSDQRIYDNGAMFGFTTYNSGGSNSGSSTYQQSGNTAYGNNGDTYRRYGNTTYGPNGTTYQQSGNMMYGTNGVACQQYGSQLYCNR